MENIAVSEVELKSICERVGGEITSALQNEKKIPLIVGVMKGALNFMMDLLPYIKLPIYTDFIQISSYNGTGSTGQIKLLKDLSFDCKDRSVVVVEDIVDSGLSMAYLREHLKSFHAKKVYICALLDKKAGRKCDVKVDFVGKELVGNEFLCGYGLDYNELERNLPYIYKVGEKELAQLNQRLKKDKE